VILISVQDDYRIYEQMMQTPPSNTRGSGSGKYKNPVFKYKYEDIACKYCLHHEKCETNRCTFIMENLNDLLCDKNFINAVSDVINCISAHKQTLILLNKRLEEYIIKLDREVEK